jgi:putative solute:sodium symporter small subunit
LALRGRNLKRRRLLRRGWRWPDAISPRSPFSATQSRLGLSTKFYVFSSRSFDLALQLTFGQAVGDRTSTNHKNPTTAEVAKIRNRTREKRSMDSKEDDHHWQRTSKLMLVMMALWLFFGYIVHMFVVPLNGIKIFGFPLGFYMAAQGSLIAFVVMLFWFAKAQDNIDRDAGVAEDD